MLIFRDEARPGQKGLAKAGLGRRGLLVKMGGPGAVHNLGIWRGEGFTRPLRMGPGGETHPSLKAKGKESGEKKEMEIERKTPLPCLALHALPCLLRSYLTLFWFWEANDMSPTI